MKTRIVEHSGEIDLGPGFRGSWGTGVYQASIRFEIVREDDKAVFYGRGMVWSKTSKVAIYQGQCLPEMAAFYSRNPRFAEFYKVWSQWHGKRIPLEVIKRVKENFSVERERCDNPSERAAG